MNHPKTYVTCAFVAFSALFTGACETSTEPANINHPKSSEDTDLWAGDIIELQAEQFFNSDFMRSYESQLIASYGAEIVATAAQWNAKNYSAYNQLFSYQYFIGFMKPLSKRVALGTRFERRIYSEPFEVEGLTQTIFLNDEVLNTWRRDVSLRFSFIYKW